MASVKDLVTSSGVAADYNLLKAISVGAFKSQGNDIVANSIWGSLLFIVCERINPANI